MGGVRLCISPDPEQTCQALARAFADLAVRAAADHGHLAVALAGGQSPKRLYHILARDYRTAVPWESVYVFWGDERYVRPDHADSNYGTSRATLLQHVPVQTDRVFPMPTTHPDPAEAGRLYETALRATLGEPPRLDLILLGLGDDAHTASLFPGSAAIRETVRLVMPAHGAKPPRVRLTFTPVLINGAAAVYFLVTGSSKARAVKQTLQGPDDPFRYPAQVVKPRHGEVVWWLDAEAAQELE